MERGNKNKKLILTAGKIWARLGLVVLILIVAYGILAPVLCSNSDSDFGVFLGLFVMWAAPFFCIWILYPIVKSIINNI